MNSLKQIRRQFQLSQTAMAAMLHVSRSTIAMIEADQRNLSAEAVTILANLQLQETAAQHPGRMAIAKSFTSKIAAAERSLLQKSLTYRLQQLQQDLHILQYNINTIEEQNNKAIETLQQVTARRLAYRHFRPGHLTSVWLDSLEATAHIELHRAPAHEIELLRIKHEVISFEIAIIKRRIKSYKQL